MTVRRQAQQRPYGFLITKAGVVLVGLGSLFAFVVGLTSLAAALAVFGVAVAAAMVLSAAMMRSFNCPDCSALLRPPQGWWYRFSGREILFRCDRCDIDWDFGVKGQED